MTAPIQWRMCGSGYWIARQDGQTIALAVAYPSRGSTSQLHWAAATYRPQRPGNYSGRIDVVRAWLAKRFRENPGA